MFRTCRRDEAAAPSGPALRHCRRTWIANVTKAHTATTPTGARYARWACAAKLPASTIAGKTTMSPPATHNASTRNAAKGSRATDGFHTSAMAPVPTPTISAPTSSIATVVAMLPPRRHRAPCDADDGGDVERGHAREQTARRSEHGVRNREHEELEWTRVTRAVTRRVQREGRRHPEQRDVPGEHVLRAQGDHGIVGQRDPSREGETHRGDDHGRDGQQRGDDGEDAVD